MSGTIPKIVDQNESDWKSLFHNEPSAFTKIHSGGGKKIDGLIYMIGLRGKNGNHLAIPAKSRSFFDIENRGFVFTEISSEKSSNQQVFSRDELPTFNFSEAPNNSIQEVYLSMDDDIGFTIDLLAFDVYESVESVQVYYFNENSKQGIINSIEKYKAEIQEIVNQGFKSDGFIPRDSIYSQGYPLKFIEMLESRVQYHKVSNFYQLPIPPIYEKSKQSNRNQLILIGLFMIFLIFQLRREFSANNNSQEK